MIWRKLKQVVQLSLRTLTLLSLLMFLPAPSAFASGSCDELHPPTGSLAGQKSPGSHHRSHAAPAANLWRAIDTVVVIPSEFLKDPNTGQLLSMSDAEIRAEVETNLAQANTYLRPLQVYLRLIDLRIYRVETQDPYFHATSQRNAYDVLATAVSLSQTYDNERDFLLVLGKGYFRGTYGLAYSGVSCQSKEYSVAFATQGGAAERLKHMLGATIAHETGHFLGMSHDADSHEAGVSIMASRPATHQFGFSTTSLQQAHSRIASGAAGGSCFAASEKPGFSGDSDFDGVIDEEEYLTGTAAHDSGSYPATLRKIVHAPWNSFLNTVNILELFNPSDDLSSIQLELLSQSGEKLHSFSFTLAAHEQRDIILNQLPGFTADSYGLVKLTTTGALDGRTSFYRSQDLSNFEFAYSVPLLNGISDQSSVSFNTYQPSHAANENMYHVANWLSLVNLSNNTAAYRITSFDQAGNVLLTRVIRLAAGARLDIDGGHGFAGPSKVGTHQILPADPANTYLAFITRYGSNASPQRAASKYWFAFPLLARAGSTQTMSLPITASTQMDNWVELSNSSHGYTTIQLDLMSSSGNILHSQEVSLAPMSQVHLAASDFLRIAQEQLGSVRVRSNSDFGIRGYSMHYYRALHGSMEGMYGIESQESIGQVVTGSYNLFLNASNTLRLTNTTSSSHTAKITLSTAEGIVEYGVSLVPFETKVVDIASLGAAADTYGVVKVELETPHSLIASIVRMATDGQKVRLAIPTILR